MNIAKLAGLLSDFEKKFSDKTCIDFYAAKKYICNLIKMDIDDKYIEMYLKEKGYKHLQKSEQKNQIDIISRFDKEETFNDENMDSYDELSDDTIFDNIIDIDEENKLDLSFDLYLSMDQILDLKSNLNYNKHNNIPLYDNVYAAKTRKIAFSFADNRRLLEEYVNGSNIEILELLLEINIRLVYKEAQYYSKQLGGHCLTYDDLVQEGCMGLIKAIKKYNPSLGYEFSTYALYWIKQAMTRAICDKENIVRIPVHAMELIFKIRKCESSLLRTKGVILPDDVCNEIGIPLQKYLFLKAVEYKFVSITSLDIPVGEEEDTPLIDFIPTEHSNDIILDAVVASDLRDKLNIALDTLNPREKKVLCLRFGLEDGAAKTLEEIGNVFNFTRERARQIEAKALRKLRHPTRSRKLKDFLI